MKDHPLVSVVITCFNNSSYIERCIESVLNQTYSKVEIIVVNDKSSDDSIERLRNYFPKIKIIDNQINLGVSASRNIGYRAASGAFITQLDGDDMFHPQKIENEVLLALKNPGSIISSQTINVSQDACAPAKEASHIKAKNFKKLKTLNIKYRIGFFGRDWLIPKNVSKKLKYSEDISFYEDWKFKLELSQLANVLIIPTPGTFYRQHSGGLSSKPSTFHRQKQIEIFNAVFPKNKSQIFIFKILAYLRFFKGWLMFYFKGV